MERNIVIFLNVLANVSFRNFLDCTSQSWRPDLLGSSVVEFNEKNSREYKKEEYGCSWYGNGKGIFSSCRIHGYGYNRV